MKLYLYLAKRNKTGIMMISVFESVNLIEAVRLTDFSKLGLPIEEVSSLQKLFDDHKMDWEPWLETAKNYLDLKAKLNSRNFKNIPNSCKPMHSSYGYNDPYIIELPIKNKPTMLRKINH